MTTTKNEDLRVKKTKAKLFDTFAKLLEIMNFDNISINELCAFANIRRATFYRHFNDKTHFCVFVLQELRDRFDKMIWKKPIPSPEADYYILYAEKIIDFLDNNEKIVENLLESSILSSLLEIIINQNSKDTYALLEQSRALGLKLPASTDITTVMLTGGVAAAVLAWIKSNKKTPKDEFTKEISTLTKRILGAE